MSALRRRARVRVRVTGTVQGVGFRPFVYRLAEQLGLAGYVLNDARGVLVEAEGGDGDLELFVGRLASEAPPLAVVEAIESQALEPLGDRTFAIRDSPRGAVAPDAPVTPDTATCQECLAELFDPDDRRFRYPFINCTNCGPRFTIVRGIPYDRPFTTMADFTMCDACRAEYENPRDRRFHAQPNACPGCGPAALLLMPDGQPVLGPDPVRAAAERLSQGAILAVKGIGGFHLACRADDECAVNTLRARKHREDKPFALMAADLAQAEALVQLEDEERALLCSPARPIVLAARRKEAAVAGSVAPGTPELGLMLAYSPLHHLLLADCGFPLVMTSGNVSDEPIAFEDADARQRLSAIADGFLLHNRPIETRTDDSVARVALLGTDRRRLLHRRSRGYVPASIDLPQPAARPILACGAELKSTFCVAKGGRAWVSHHIGDLQNYETLRSFATGVDHFEQLFAVTPEVVVHDLHPEYLSTKYALERDGVEHIGVQHHHAHLAACLAEHGDPGPAVGAIFDGTGYGADGTIWGGEVLLGDLHGFRRMGALRTIGLPGGERAIRQPWRMACAWLAALDECPEPGPVMPPTLEGRVDPERWRQVAKLCRSELNSPPASSVGRLFDAVSALCGIRTEINYEGQAAIELEARCDAAEPGSYPFAVTREGELEVIDPREMLQALMTDISRGLGVGAIASRFHAGLAAATVELCSEIAAAAGTDLVVLSGGVFLNRRLLEATSTGLYRAGLRVLVPGRLPPGDGGISYGQAAVAAAHGERRDGR
jgi:hydrogenase maturation protein HypF